MITIKQYNDMLQEIHPAIITAPKGAEILMTDSLFKELNSVLDHVSSDEQERYYFFGLHVQVVVTETRELRWWVVKGCGRINEALST